VVRRCRRRSRTSGSARAHAREPDQASAISSAYTYERLIARHLPYRRPEAKTSNFSQVTSAAPTRGSRSIGGEERGDCRRCGTRPSRAVTMPGSKR
jgi:hypothetical protein